MRDAMNDALNDGQEAHADPLVREAAALWLRLQAAPGDEALQRQIREWRGISAVHERIFAATRETWGLAGELAAVSVPAGVRRSAPRRPWQGRRPRRLGAGLVAAAAAACLAVIAFPSLALLWQADYRTATGEKRSVSLADGSSVLLDTNSAITVDYGDARRGIRLLAGRAWFDVAKDPDRPFTVAAADVDVTVTGTAFDVDLSDGAIDVALARGGIRVTGAGGRAIAMQPGDQLRIARQSGKVLRGHAAVSSMGSWRRDRLLLNDVTLAEGVAQLGRYHQGAIIVTDAALEARRVTGVFETGDPGQALRLMVRQHGAAVHEVTPWLMIVSKR